MLEARVTVSGPCANEPSPVSPLVRVKARTSGIAPWSAFGAAWRQTLAAQPEPGRAAAPRRQPPFLRRHTGRRRRARGG